MNSKLIKASLAGVAAIAVTAGGTTFAAFSDFGTVAGTAGAGALTLELKDETGSAVQPITTPTGGLAPGENKIQDFFIASRSDNTTALKDAALSLTLDNLVGIEDGCTSNSESVEDSDGCTAATPGGEFPVQAYVQFSIKPATSATTCSTGGYANSATRQGTLASMHDVKLPIGILDATNPNEGTCVRMELGLPDQTMGNAVDFAWPAKADNKVQGDSAAFDLRFDLEQV